MTAVDCLLACSESLQIIDRFMVRGESSSIFFPSQTTICGRLSSFLPFHFKSYATKYHQHYPRYPDPISSPTRGSETRTHVPFTTSLKIVSSPPIFIIRASPKQSHTYAIHNCQCVPHPRVSTYPGKFENVIRASSQASKSGVRVNEELLRRPNSTRPHPFHVRSALPSSVDNCIHTGTHHHVLIAA